MGWRYPSTLLELNLATWQPGRSAERGGLALLASVAVPDACCDARHPKAVRAFPRQLFANSHHNARWPCSQVLASMRFKSDRQRWSPPVNASGERGLTRPRAADPARHPAQTMSTLASGPRRVTGGREFAGCTTESSGESSGNRTCEDDLDLGGSRALRCAARSHQSIGRRRTS